MTKKIIRKVAKADDYESAPVKLLSKPKTAAKSDELRENNKSLTSLCSVLTFLLVMLWIVTDVQKSAICNNLVLESLRPDISTTCNQNPLQFVMIKLSQI